MKEFHYISKGHSVMEIKILEIVHNHDTRPKKKRKKMCILLWGVVLLAIH